MDNEHRISIAAYRDTTPEQEARRIFRAFTPDMFAHMVSGLLADPTQVVTTLLKDTHHSFYRSPSQQQLLKTFPDMFALNDLFYQLDGDLVIQTYPDIFRALIQKPDEPVSDMLRNSLGLSITLGGVHPRLQIGLMSAFTPVYQRQEILAESISDSPQRRREVAHLIRQTPDLTHLQTIAERVDGVTSLLTYSLEDAIRDSQPGQVRENFYAMLVDQKHRGKNNLFTFDPEHSDIPSTTRFGQCPATGYARNFLQGVGVGIRDNREAVTNILEQVIRSR